MTQRERYELMMQMLDAYDEFRKRFLEITGTIVNSGNATKDVGKMAKAVGEAYNRLNNAAFDFVGNETEAERMERFRKEYPGLQYGVEMDINMEKEEENM